MEIQPTIGEIIMKRIPTFVWVIFAGLLFLSGCEQDNNKKEVVYEEPVPSEENVNKITADILKTSAEIKKAVIRFKSEVPLYEASGRGLLQDLVSLGYISSETLLFPIEWKYKEQLAVKLKNQNPENVSSVNVLYSTMPKSLLNLEVCKNINQQLTNLKPIEIMAIHQTIIIDEQNIYLEHNRSEDCGNSGSGYDYYVLIPN